MRKIGIFGGTFNPPHIAHKRLATEMAKVVGFDEIIIIPTYTPPHKETSSLADCEHRLEMCRLTFSEKLFSVSDIEIRRKGKSYTVETVSELKKRYRGDKLFLLVGSDMLLSFHRWYKFEEILQNCTLCVISRDDEEGKKLLCQYAEKTLGLREEKGEIVVLNSDAVELSSTEIREKIKKGEDVCRLLEEKTGEYIKEKGLYL
ncbi:MAG: nicotinate (nicotinamide) nucleotide adenylyltransferase [Clostridia bacterium]|nr:nicotinate (nicotinamide) nucleotide adenylyltransferase [Clostridia bacterium]MBQ8029875.1 nicotinate (nicotinamide) nucleotide adenylyltransferase [Clostridia bacterium]